MLTLKEARKLGLKKCREIIGEDFVEKYQANACAAYSAKNTQIISVFLGVSKEESKSTKLLENEEHFDNEIIVYVDRRTGKIKIDND